MTNKKTTKRALIASVVSLLLCFTMLMGTTYAWFTDSVESKNNIIMSGNLDVVLEWYDYDETAQTGTWKPVDADTNVFDDALWEPGHTEVVYLRVSNAGSLALKYNLGVNVASETEGVNVDGKTFKLSDYIEFGVVEGKGKDGDVYATREAARGAVKDSSKVLNAGYSKSSTLVKTGDAEYVALVVYMPETVGNEANYKTGTKAPEIRLGINLFATQLSSESDSFGTDYDKAAPWAGDVDTAWYDEAEEGQTEFVLETAAELAGLASIVNSGKDTFTGKTVKLGADMDLSNVAWTPIGTESDVPHSKSFGGSFYGNGFTIYNLNVRGTEGVGLFGIVGTAAHIEGVQIDGATVVGNHWVGAVMGYGYLAENTLKDCVVKNATVTAIPSYENGVYDNGDKVGAVAGMAINGNITNNKAENCIVAGYRDVGGIVGCAQAENRSIEVTGNSVDESVTIAYVGASGEYADGKTNQNMDGILGRANEPYDYTVTKSANTNDAACFEVVATVVAEADELVETLAEGGNIVFVESISVSEAIEIAEGDETTLYLNGKTLTVDGGDDNPIINNGTLVIKDGDVVTDNGFSINYGTMVLDADVCFTANEHGAIWNLGGDLLIDGATVNSKGSNYGVYNGYTNYGGTAVINNATINAAFGAINVAGSSNVTVNGGTYTASGWPASSSHVIYTTSTATLTVNGGTYTHKGQGANGSVLYVNYDSTVNINGGTFTAEGTAYGLAAAETSTTNINGGTFANSFMEWGGSITVKGGSFKADPTKYVAEGYQVTKIDDVYAVTVKGITPANDAESLNDAFKNGEDVVLIEDIEEEPATTAPYGNKVMLVHNGGVFDGNGNTVSMEDVVNSDGRCDNYTVMTSGGTIKNLYVDAGFRGMMIMSPTSTIYLDNVHVGGDTVGYSLNTGEGDFTQDLVVTNSSFKGWNSWSNIKSASFTNCEFGQGTYWGANSIYGRVVRPYVNSIFTNCSFIEHMNLDLSKLGEGQKVTFVDCTVNGQPITADTFTVVENDSDYDTSTFSVDLPSWATSISDCVKFPVETSNSEDLSEALGNGDYVVLNGDVSVDNCVVMNGGTLDGNGATIDGTSYDKNGNDSDCAITTTGGTISNVTVEGAFRGLGSGSSGDYGLTEDLYIDHVTVDGGVYGINTGTGNGYKMVVTDSTINGWTSYSGLSVAEFTNCKFNATDELGYGYFAIYDDSVFTNCEFGSDVTMGPGEADTDYKNNESDRFTVTINNCTVNGVKVTAENFETILAEPYDIEIGNWAWNTVIVDGVTVVWSTAETNA